MPTSSRKKLLSFISTLLFGFLILGLQDYYRVESNPKIDHSSEIASTSTNAFIIRAVDGDTLKVRLDGKEDEVTVRLLGVNTPESVDPRRPVECFGKEASTFTASLTEGRRARLESDPQADEVDRYGRLLRNVILADGMDLNAELVKQGYAYAYLNYPLDPARKTQLMYLQNQADEQQLGLWGEGGCR